MVEGLVAAYCLITSALRSPHARGRLQHPQRTNQEGGDWDGGGSYGLLLEYRLTR